MDRPADPSRSELRGADERVLDETDDYLSALRAEVGEPSTEEVARAEAIARRLRDGARAQRTS